MSVGEGALGEADSLLSSKSDMGLYPWTLKGLSHPSAQCLPFL